MKSKDRIVIQKLIEYTKDIGKYIDGLYFETFMNDKKTISACAFTIGQIGELVSNIDLSTQELYSQIPWRGIRGMRNRIIHNYENVDLDNIVHGEWKKLNDDEQKYIINNFDDLINLDLIDEDWVDKKDKDTIFNEVIKIMTQTLKNYDITKDISTLMKKDEKFKKGVLMEATTGFMKFGDKETNPEGYTLQAHA